MTMRLTELVPAKGTYAALRVLDNSCNGLYEYCRANKIPVRKSQFDERLHVTLIYSRVHCPKMFAEPGIIYNCEFKDFEIFTGGNGKKALVALLHAPLVEARHLQLMAKHGASYDFPVYHPHITLSYDYTGSDEDFASLPPIEFGIKLGKEYVEDLDLDWKT